MITDKYGQQILDENDLCRLYLKDPNGKYGTFLLKEPIKFDSDLELESLPIQKKYEPLDCSLEEFDNAAQMKWLMPKEYQELDIAEWVLDQCSTNDELNRAGEELILYQERDLFPMLQYMKYLVDTMRKNKIVWGVGRGSSVSSFVLFLIGIHKINSLEYGLNVNEFLK